MYVLNFVLVPVLNIEVLLDEGGAGSGAEAKGCHTVLERLVSEEKSRGSLVNVLFWRYLFVKSRLWNWNPSLSPFRAITFSMDQLFMKLFSILEMIIKLLNIFFSSKLSTKQKNMFLQLFPETDGSLQYTKCCSSSRNTQSGLVGKWLSIYVKNLIQVHTGRPMKNVQ